MFACIKYNTIELSTLHFILIGKSFALFNRGKKQNFNNNNSFLWIPQHGGFEIRKMFLVLHFRGVVVIEESVVEFALVFVFTTHVGFKCVVMEDLDILEVHVRHVELVFVDFTVEGVEEW